jgi:hypothetical protein
MRKSRRRRNPPVHGRAHRYGDSRLEGTQAIGLEDTCAASDAVAVVQQGAPGLDDKCPNAPAAIRGIE